MKSWRNLAGVSRVNSALKCGNPIGRSPSALMSSCGSGAATLLTEGNLRQALRCFIGRRMYQMSLTAPDAQDAVKTVDARFEGMVSDHRALLATLKGEANRASVNIPL